MKFLKNHVAFFLLILISLTPFAWFTKKDYMINGVDTNFPLNPNSWLKLRFYLWNDTTNSGQDNAASISGVVFHAVQALFYKLGLSIIDTEKITLIFWFFLQGLSIYFLIHVLQLVFFKNSNSKLQSNLAKIIGVVIYLFNVYQLDVWKNVKVANLMLMISSPIILALLILLLHKKINKWLCFLLVSITSIITAGIGLNPAYFAILSFILFSYFVFELFYGDAKQKVKNFLGFFLVQILSSAFWLLPLSLNILGITGERVLGIADLGVDNWLYGLSKNTSVLSVMRLLGAWDWYEKGLKKTPYVPFAHIYFTNNFFVLFSFVLPILAFLGTYLARRTRISLYFTFITLFGIVFATGAKEPFGVLYMWLHKNIPFFSLFRSPWYIFSPLIVIGYAVLISIFFSRLSGKVKNIYFNVFLAGLFIVLNLIFSYPMINGQIFRPDQTYGTFFVKIPDYIFNSGKFANKIPYDKRVLNLPFVSAENYNWGYSGVTPILQLMSNTGVIYPIYGKSNQGFVTELGSKIEEKIIRGEGSRAKNLLSMLSVGYVLNKNDLFDKTPIPEEKFLNDFKQVHKIGEWDFYKSDLENNLFYTANSFLKINGGSRALAEISTLSDFPQNPSAYVTSINSVLQKEKNYEKIYSVPNCMGCELQRQNLEELPYVRFLPGSVFYKIIEWKENSQRKKIQDPLENYKFSLLLARKRLAEARYFAISRSDNPRAFEFSLNGFKQEVNNCIFFLEEAERNKRNVNGEWLELSDNLNMWSGNLYNFLNRSLPIGIHEQVQNIAYVIENKRILVNKKIWTSTDVNHKKFFIPISEQGVYKVLIYNDKLVDKYFLNGLFNNLSYQVDATMSGKINSQRTDEWINYGEVSLSEGEHKLNLDFPSPKNLIENAKNIYQISSNKFLQTLHFKVSGLLPTYEYVVRFDYRVLNSQSPRLRIIQPNGNEFEREDIYREYDLSANQRWASFISTIKPNRGENDVLLMFDVPPDQSSEVSMEIKNLSVQINYTPEIVFQMESLKTVQNNNPEISYQKISPVEYLVHVADANKPYTLIFNEGYNKGWTASINGESIKNENHYLTNGFANAWDIDKPGNYTIHVYYSYQKWLVIASVVSLFTLIALSVAVVYKKVKNR